MEPVFERKWCCFVSRQSMGCRGLRGRELCPLVSPLKSSSGRKSTLIYAQSCSPALTPIPLRGAVGQVMNACFIERMIANSSSPAACEGGGRGARHNTLLCDHSNGNGAPTVRARRAPSREVAWEDPIATWVAQDFRSAKALFVPSLDAQIQGLNSCSKPKRSKGSCQNPAARIAK